MKKQLNNKNNQKNNSTLYLMWSCILGIFLFIKDLFIAAGHALIGFLTPFLGGLFCFLIGLFWKGLKGGINNFFKPDANPPQQQTVMIQDESKQKQEQEAHELQYSKQLGILKEQETHKKLQLQIIARQREYEKVKQEKQKLQLQIIAREQELEKQKILNQQKQQETNTEKPSTTKKVMDNIIKYGEPAYEITKGLVDSAAKGIATGIAVGALGALGGAPMLI